MNRLARTALWLVIGATVGAAAGCGPGTVKVTGKVVKNGAALPPSQTGHVEIKLIPTEAGEHYTTKIGIADKDGTFTIVDVPPGKYKVAVTQMNNPTDPTSDLLLGGFNDQNTKIIRDVDGKTPLDIDVSKPEG